MTVMTRFPEPDIRAGLNVPSEEREPLLRRVGATPLVPIRRLMRGRPGVEVYAKAEWFNPAGSVKDRPGYRMILAGEASGKLTADKVILDATSGNTGIAYAMVGAVRGYRVRLAIPANVSEERKRILMAYGVDLVLTDSDEGSDGAIRKAKDLYAEDPKRYFFPDQYNNPENPLAHYHSTAPEIIRQTEGRVTHFVACMGTSGTMMGTGRRLKEWNPAVRICSVEPAGPFHGLEGMKHMESSIKPGIYNASFADEKLFVETEEAQDLIKRLAREEGYFAGVSSGAALAGALRVARQIERGVIVTIFPDGGDRYLSERFWAA